MTMVQESVGDEAVGRVIDAHATRVRADGVIEPAAEISAREAWEVSALLQTTLDLETILELFAGKVATIVAYDSFGYQHEDKGVSYNVGAPAQHSCRYRLVITGQSLGEVLLTRESRFGEDEIVRIENLLSGLVYSLRNALAYQEALESALRDPLTGVGNRNAMDAAVQREMRLARRHKLPLSLVVIDIDKFKLINDAHGHVTGDHVLQLVAQAVTACIRSTDVFCRFGGEEFALILPGTDRQGAMLLASRIRQYVQQVRCERPTTAPAGDPSAAHGAIGITISLGVACLTETDTEQRLLDRADQAMYRSKQLGGNCVSLAS